MSFPLPPLALIVDDEPLQRAFAARILHAAGWKTLAVGDGSQALAAVGQRPALILLDLHMAGMTSAETVAAIRALPPPAGSVPVVAFTTTRLTDPAALVRFGFDDYLAKPCTPEELVSCARRWQPDPPVAAIPRLAQTFGAAEIAGMLTRFRALLIAALDRLAAGDAEEMAHRVAGIAGTLGFPALGRLWLDLADGGDVASAALRRATRLAIAQIDQTELPPHDPA